MTCRSRIGPYRYYNTCNTSKYRTLSVGDNCLLFRENLVVTTEIINFNDKNCQDTYYAIKRVLQSVLSYLEVFPLEYSIMKTYSFPEERPPFGGVLCLEASIRGEVSPHNNVIFRTHRRVSDE